MATTTNKHNIIPNVGFGTFNSFSEHDQVATSVKYAIKVGYRHFDLAKAYENEKEVGKAINECISEGLVKREELFIASKLWCSDMDPKDVKKACMNTLKALDLDYLDNFMLHWPVQFNNDSYRTANEFGGDFKYEIIHSGNSDNILATWKVMENLVDQGYVKHIGVSNFNKRHLKELLACCRIPPVSNEIELHPYLQQNSLVEYCQKKRIEVVAYSPLGKIGYKNTNDPSLIHDAVIIDVANEVNKTPAQVLLRWAIQRGTKVIPKSNTPSRIEENFDVTNWELEEIHMNRIKDLDRGFRFVKVSWYSFEEEDAISDDESGDELQQPKIIAGIVRGDTYKNSFYREGRTLKSDIILERGILKRLDERAKEIIPLKCHNANNYLITDEIVDKLFGDDVVNGINKSGISCTKIVVPADKEDETGETSCERFKTLHIFEKCCDQILKQGISKNSCIISLGGGVVNNLCGFIASCLYRGISLVHFTTTMMGMTDAAIDFKQAVNHSLGKNLLGAYYPANTIVIDTTCLQNLSKRHILNGIAEALKHALAQSRHCVETIVEPLKNDADAALRDDEYLERVCRTCIDWKVPTLIHYHESDFNEMVPQYGHAFGHAIEHLSYHKGQIPLLHGEAVAIGMCLSAEVSYIMGFCDKGVVEEHYEFVKDSKLPAFIPSTMDVDKIFEKMAFDKHFVKKPTMGLVKEIGEMKSTDDGEYSFMIENDVIMKALKANIDRRDTQKTQNAFPSPEPVKITTAVAC